MTRTWTPLALALVLGCTTAQPPPPVTDAPASAPAVARPASTGPSEFRNLQILPRDIPRPELIATMRSFTRGLGVKCNECHVVIATTPEEKLDFASDAKEEKRVARVMLQMALQINGGWLERVEAAEGHEGSAQAGHSLEPPVPFKEPRVWCWTCHRGNKEPETPPPPAPRGT